MNVLSAVVRMYCRDTPGALQPATMATSAMADNTLYLVFIHGFRGDHTSFQCKPRLSFICYCSINKVSAAFPTDLHLHLLPHIPNLQTYVYPTYKTTRPLDVARDHFLQWYEFT
jgi:hypothetical protein